MHACSITCQKQEQFEFSYNENPSYEMVRSCRAYRSEGLGHCQSTSCKPSLEAELGVCSNEGFGALESDNDATAYPGGTGPIYQHVAAKIYIVMKDSFVFAM